MRDLHGFRDAVRTHRRAVGRTQEQLARSVGLHPHALSRKLNGHGQAVLTGPEVVALATTLAAWGALTTRAEVYALLELMGVPPRAIPAGAWAGPPLSALRADPDAAPGRRAPVARPATPTAPEAGAGRPRLKLPPLPVPATPLIGRGQERAQVAAALAAARLVTVTGAGGAGKTRLALQAARDAGGRFADGVVFFDLAPVHDPAVLATTVAQTLGLSPRSAEAAEAELAGALGGREMLLVLDNLEQLLESVGLLGRLLAAVPGLRLLATSRITLRLYGEHTLRLPPLRLPADDPGAPARDSEAVQLFVARARAAQPGFDPDAAAIDTIGAICTALDGLPLAIELAAAKIRLYSPEGLLGLLGSRLALLTGGPRDRPGRQRALRTTLDWSYELLPSSSRRLFARLGVFAGPFDATAAGALGAAAPGPMLDQLADLADQGLLEIVPGPSPMFRMLQTIREYALARLAETGDHNDVRRRHLAYHRRLAAAVQAGRDGRAEAGDLDPLAAVYPDLLAALEFAAEEAGRDPGCLNQGLKLAAALYGLWVRRGPVAEGALHLGRLLDLDDALQASSTPDRVAAVLAAGWLFCHKGDFTRAAELARHTIELCAPVADHRSLSWAYLLLGEAAIDTGDDTTAEGHYQCALSEAAQAGHQRNQAEAWNLLGQIARHRGDYDRAARLLGHALGMCRAAGLHGHAGSVLGSLGEVARDTGQPARARQLYGAALRLHTAAHDDRGVAYDLEGFAAAAALDHDGRQALVYLGAAQVLREQTGAPLPPVEQRILDRILAPVTGVLPDRARRAALSDGRARPLTDVISEILSQLPPADGLAASGGTDQGGQVGDAFQDVGGASRGELFAAGAAGQDAHHQAGAGPQAGLDVADRVPHRGQLGHGAALQS